MSKIISLTDSNYEAFLSENKLPTVIDFWAEWCGPCRAIAPILEEIASEYCGTYTIAKVNVEENPQLSSKFRIRTLPALVYTKAGEIVDQSIGPVGKAKIIETLSAL